MVLRVFIKVFGRKMQLDLPGIQDRNKCSDRSIEVKLPAILGTYDRQTKRPTDRQTNRPTDRRTDRVIGKFKHCIQVYGIGKANSIILPGRRKGDISGEILERRQHLQLVLVNRQREPGKNDRTDTDKQRSKLS